ncbi:MAG: DUF362 domain-containing protein [Candidatus Geothermincolia bacterium]
MERVFLYEQANYDAERICEVAKEIITGSGVDPRGKSVLLKPSFVYPSHSPETVGVVTQPPFVQGVAKALRELGAGRVMVGEDSVIGPARSAFYAMGIYPYIRDVAEPVYFDEVRHVRVDIPGAAVQDSFIVPAVWPEADLFVSLPKIKVNQFAHVTLSVKNNLGFLRQAHRAKNHNDETLHEKIADLYRVRSPDLVLADSIVAGEGQGPMVARPVELGVMIGGANGVAVDAVACRLMGFDPEQISHLNYLAEAGVGPLGEGDIEVVGERVGDYSREFVRPSTQLVGIHDSLRVFEGEEKCCAFGCRGMVRCALDAWLERGRHPLKEMNIIIGKGHGDLPADIDRRRTLVVGNCAEDQRRHGTYLPGCPPLPMETAFAVQKFQGFVPTPMRMRDIGRGYVAGYGWKAARFFRGYRHELNMEE